MNPVMTVHTMNNTKNQPQYTACWMWCPGCKLQVMLPVLIPGVPYDGTTWEWDGNKERPTFNPSILQHESGLSIPRCHSYIRDGRWEFLSDSTHPLAGQTVDMVPLPDWMVRYFGGRDMDEEVTWP